MSEPRHIADQLRRSMDGPAWHGDSLSEILNGVTEEIANARPILVAHTIHETLLHLITWQELAEKAIRGHALPQWPFPEDWPDSRSVSWQLSRERLSTSMHLLAQAVEDMPEIQLAAEVPGRDFSFYVLLHGVAQHNAYHGGQIALIRKSAQPRTS